MTAPPRSIGSPPAPAPPQDARWRCALCTATNPAGHAVCRVCRSALAEPDVGLPRTLEEDTFAPAPLSHVVPLSFLLLVAGVLAASNVPKASTWGGGVAPGGWQVGVRVNRAEELRIAAKELRALVEAYRDTLAAGEQLDERWSRRLAALRTTWEIYGDGKRFPGLEGPEIELASAMQDIASLRASAQDADTAAGLGAVLVRIQKTEEILADVD